MPGTSAGMSIVESLLPLVSFVFVASITPGPNNLMLAASGIGFGLRRTLPHIAGIAVGFAALLVVCALGAGALITGIAGAGLALKLAGSAYLVYLAIRLGYGPTGITLLALIATMVNLPCVSLWAVAGSTIRMRLADPRWQRRCTIVVVALTLYAAIAVWP